MPGARKDTIVSQLAASGGAAGFLALFQSGTTLTAATAQQLASGAIALPMLAGNGASSLGATPFNAGAGATATLTAPSFAGWGLVTLATGIGSTATAGFDLTFPAGLTSAPFVFIQEQNSIPGGGFRWAITVAPTTTQVRIQSSGGIIDSQSYLVGVMVVSRG